MKLPSDGGCRCGKTRIRVTQAPMLGTACHCTGCQRMTASAFSLSLAIPAPGFEVTAGTPVIGGLHGSSHHFMCDYCMSWMFTRPEGLDSLVNVRATMLDDHAWFAPFVELYTSEMMPWAKTGAPHSYSTMPANDEFMRLVPLYAQFASAPATTK